MHKFLLREIFAEPPIYPLPSVPLKTPPWGDLKKNVSHQKLNKIETNGFH